MPGVDRQPYRVGTTPLKAQHINELRVCLERIIQHLGVTPVDPVGDITVTEVLRERCRNFYTCIYVTFTNNSSGEVRLYPWLRVYDEDDQLLWVYESSSFRVASGGRERRYSRY